MRIGAGIRTGTPPRQSSTLILVTLCILSFLVTRKYLHYHQELITIQIISNTTTTKVTDPGAITPEIEAIAQSYRAKPILTTSPDLKNLFGELGLRVQTLTTWFNLSSKPPSPSQLPTPPSPLHLLAENLTLAHFPFLTHPDHPNDPTPLTTLRTSFIPGTKGIVIPVGADNVRFSIHLLLNLRVILKSKLPIQIAFAGGGDLPTHMREKMLDIDKDLEFLDITKVFDDKVMGAREWAVKPFAVLASSFEKVVLMDADSVFVQKPEVLFEDEGFGETGTLFFHDRLIFQHGFKDRRKWWEEQLKGHVKSKSINESLVWKEDYAEEADSGVVVLDKSRLPVLMGLLHTCWQNTRAVRDEVTYKMTYGDKESWWFGLELCGVPYSFENHYAAVLGEGGLRSGDQEEVCGFTIAHTDRKDKLLWYNGSLLRNKAEDGEYAVPLHWMLDGKWEKGRTKADLSCMKGAKARYFDESIVIAPLVEMVYAMDTEKLIEEDRKATSDV